MHGNRLNPFIGTGRRGKEHRRKTHAVHLDQEFVRLFNDHVNHQHAIGAGCRRIIGKAKTIRSAKWD